jgi:hypothetical protein
VNVEPIIRTARDYDLSFRDQMMSGAARVDGFAPDAPMRFDMPDEMAARMDDAPAPSTAEMLDALRAARPDDPQVRRLANDLRVADAGDGTLAQAEAADAAQRIEQAWRALPPEQQGSLPLTSEPVAGGAPVPTRATTEGAPGSPVSRNAVPPSPARPPDLRAALREAGFVERPADAAALASAQAARARADGGARVETPVGRLDADNARLDAEIADHDAMIDEMVRSGRLSEAEAKAARGEPLPDYASAAQAGAACIATGRL